MNRSTGARLAAHLEVVTGGRLRVEAEGAKVEARNLEYLVAFDPAGSP